MPSRAETLLQRRHDEARERARQRRRRRRSLLELFVVFVVVVPVVAAAIAADRREPAEVVLRPEHITFIAAAGAPHEAVAPNRRPAGRVPAPSSVKVVAKEHGGGPRSRWVPAECENVAELVRDNGLPDWMTTVAWRESRCQHRAKNFDRRTADQSYGLFQINVLGYLWEESRDRCGLRRPEELLDPKVNVSCAAALYRAYGYQPWDSGRYFRR
jgi:hypothetical protein